jgi:hypothetical protein
MGVASGLFEPTEAFGPVRSEFKPVRNGAGQALPSSRYVDGLSAKTAEGNTIECLHVEICEAVDAESSFGWEVFCVGIPYPLTGNFFRIT